MSHDLERIRDYVEGRLKPAEREAFAAEVSRDAELSELVETYELVVRATADAVPAATTSFGDVMLRAGAAPRWRAPLLAAAAAALLIAAGVWQLAPGKPEPLVLASIPLALLPAPQAPPDWPPELLTHSTADEDGLVWYDDMETALAVARAAGRPVFLFIDYPGCPLCRRFRAEHCKDEGVIRAADAFVLLNLSWTREMGKDPSEGFPFYDLLDSHGKRTAGFTGLPPPAEVAAWLGEKAAPRPDWKGLGDQARKLEEAEALEDPAACLALYRQVAREQNVLGEAARARIAAMEKEAQDALFEAKGSPEAALRLDAAIDRLRGTPYAADLERVRSYVREHGSFPELKEE